MTTSTENTRTFETYDATLTKIEFLTPRVKGLRFQLPAGKLINFRAGQFVQMYIPTPEKVRRTSYSVASAPFDHDHVDLCVTLVRDGVSSNYLHKMKEGDKIQMMGPLGRFTLPEALPRDIVFVCAGSGVAPFRSMILDLLHNKTDKNVYLVFGNRYEHDIIYRNEFQALEGKHDNFKKLFTLSQGDSNWTGQRGYVQDKLVDFIPNPAQKDFYICGLVKMIDGVVEKLQSLGVPKEQIHYERYD